MVSVGSAGGGDGVTERDGIPKNFGLWAGGRHGRLLWGRREIERERERRDAKLRGALSM